MAHDEPLPVLGFVATSGTGKTTLLTRLLPLLKARGLRCGVVKHSHHDFAIDIPGKDSYRLREAGADQVMLASPHRMFLVEERDGLSEPELPTLLARLDRDGLDLVLVEGFSRARVPKIELFRRSLGLPRRCDGDPDLIAVATDDEASLDEVDGVPSLPLNDPDAVADFIAAWLLAARS
ncbi:MAG: molybdopterin-guanine dinucleotide biosynthesis protein B [Gammaproteobacteria bacterium]|nr:molybdopterin-guanine dinucleotide biosynthesis protein B [Gammaproteobacteria bacterium]MCP5298788.1 molybdopterin-guanine dinucleotide biosynthesis protein B [Chromatiaceae bacterium]